MKANGVFAQIIKDGAVQGYMWVDHETSTAKAFSWLWLWSQCSVDELTQYPEWLSYSEGEMIQHIERLPVSEVNFDTSTVSNACCQFLEFRSFPKDELKQMEHLNVERMELEDVPFAEIVNMRHIVAQKWPNSFRIADNYVVQKYI